MSTRKISIISFSVTGGHLAQKAAEHLTAEDREISVFCLKKYAGELCQEPALPDLKQWCGRQWEEVDALVFIGASGIAVRTIAPYVKSKVTDPAVLVLDEGGHFVISLLSGHLGGANALTGELADGLGAIPVITTATDVQHKFAVDVWAKKNDLVIDSMKMAKEISAAVLQEIPVCLYSGGRDIVGTVPSDLRVISSKEELRRQLDADERSLAICISEEIPEEIPGDRVLRLIPKCVVLGIGCRRDQDFEKVDAMTREALERGHIDVRAVRRICSIDLKKKEPGIRKLAEELGVPFDTFSAEELCQVPGDFTTSGFVASITGVDNVCERSAMAGSPNGRLILKKQAGSGVTVAAASEYGRIRF